MPERRSSSALNTVLFTDIVSSTEIAEEMGNRRWRELLSRYHDLVRREVRRFGGREVDTAGDGFFGTFDRPANALRCACVVVEGVRRLGIEARAGLHTGEVEVVGKKVSGLAVHIGARVMATAGPGQVIATRTVRELVAGTGFEFDDLGERSLRGVEGTWSLFSVKSFDSNPLSPPSSLEAARQSRDRIQPAPLASRWPLVIGGAAILAVGAGMAIALVSGGSGGRRGQTGPGQPTRSVMSSPSPAQGSVQRYDLASESKIGSPTVVGAGADDVAVGGGAVWVTDSGTGSVYHIDPKTGDLIHTIPVGKVRQVVTGNGVDQVWVTGVSTVSRIDPISDRVSYMATLPSVAGDATAGQGWIWVTLGVGDQVERIRPTNGSSQTLGICACTPDVVYIAAGGGFLWELKDISPSSSEVEKIDPSTGRRVGFRSVPDAEPAGLVIGGGSVWVLTTDGVVSRIDAHSGKLVRRIQLDRGTSRIAFGEGSVWVLNPRAGGLARIDPSTGDIVRTIQVGPGTNAVAVGEGSIWVTAQSA